MFSSALLRDRKMVLVRRGVPIALGGVIITGAGMAYADHGNGGPDYRTASASVGEVDQLVTLTGTVAKLTQEDASFGVSGTVKKVAVATGDKVTKGDVLATLDTTDLDAAVTAAKATLAKAKAQLETDGAAGDSSSSSTSTTSSSGSGSAGTGSGGSAGTGSSGQAGAGTGSGSSGSGAASTTVGGVDLAAPTNAVVAALATATADLAKVTDAVTARDAACDTVLNSDGATSTSTATDSGSSDAGTAGSGASDAGAADSGSLATGSSDSGAAGAGSSGSGSTDSGSDDTTATAGDTAATPVTTDDLKYCIAAVDAVTALQNQVATDQAAVQTKETALKAAMDQAVAALTEQAAAASSGTTGSDSTGATGGTGSGGGSGATGGSGADGGRQTNAVDQAARIAVDNAAILSAQAALDSADEDLDEATLTAPIDGIVGAIGITKGSSASTSNTITILGDGAVKVTLDVPQATAQKLRKGMTATVTADGANAASDGTVESVGIVPSSSGGAGTYPVVVVVNNPADGLAEGAAATVAITLRAVDNAVTVPNSAVTSTGTGATGYVTLLQNGRAVRQTVTTGAVGATVTQIVSGVTAGQTVVLADTAADVPASSTAANAGGANVGGGGFLGGFGGGAGGGTGRRG
jgi:multidrug efflux pump subunit AcrA (membrane-fusion protein)